MLLSLPFFIGTIVIYASYDALRNIYGKCILCYSIGLMIAFVSLLITKFMDNSASDEPYVCKIFGYILYISFTFAFFWLSIIGFHIWRVTR